ncbi:MAG: aconitate hydratase [Alphaproteobacteria bacterium]|nr:aconitate hydratase [Alphaproteobacteria bacterium]MBT5389951.1 aconitate hydratase [Alphaproteobacteria bacterium]MBT5540033.1 aconitate hydratase [Alphaproteobacteria bacterium]MBT5655008.1 aconitate hydratase [Alphaproteobacteria bacterium]
MNVAQKLIKSHLLAGEMTAGSEISLKIDQTLTQDATGTLVMLELEAMNLQQAKTELSAQYVDHNLLQEDSKNPDDHLFLQSACQRFGLWFARPGGGISHVVHMQNFGVPGKTLLGSDSHTCAAGSMGMLAMGAGGLEVAEAIAGHPFYVKMPKIMGIKLTGSLPDWVSAKDVILEFLRRHNVKGGVGKILEYYGPGLKHLTAMDRHVIANMGAELGATTSVFPSDEETKLYLQSVGRPEDWKELLADPEATYDLHDEIDMSQLEPMIAKPSSPGNVVAVREIEGEELSQSYIGSSANPGFRDFAITAEMVKSKQVHDQVSFDINPSSRIILEDLLASGHLNDLIHSGARLHQTGCNGCIGMGQAPATGRNSLRTVPRNFPGRSGTKEDSVFLCSPETATASALMGKITDPRSLGMAYPKVTLPEKRIINRDTLQGPLPLDEALKVELIKGPNIASIPHLEPLPDVLELPILLKVGDDISTDGILPAGARVLPYRSNIPKISEFCFEQIDDTYAPRAEKQKKTSGHAIIAGDNYGQGSSREHAALAPRYLGLRLVIAKSFARIHWQNLVNFGVLPVTFESPEDFDTLGLGDTLVLKNIHRAISMGDALEATVKCSGKQIKLTHELSKRQIDILLNGGLINWLKGKHEGLKTQAL